MSFFFCHYIIFDGILATLTITLCFTAQHGTRWQLRDVLSQHNTLCHRNPWLVRNEVWDIRKGEALQRWEKPALTEAYHIEAQYFKTFLLQDFCTKSHRYCHFQFQPVLQFLLQDWRRRKMLLRSSAGFVLFLLSQCTVSLGTKEAVVLANAHLLPQRDYESLENANEKGTHEDSEWYGRVQCCTLLLCCNIFNQHVRKLALEE